MGSENQSLSDFASGYLYFGLHKIKRSWYLREWAPNATAIYVLGTFNDWKKDENYRLYPLEAHKLYIDIQMPLSTTEFIGFKPVSRCEAVSEVYDNDRDIVFYADDFDTILSVSPGQFVIFYPQDAHAPAMASGYLRKLVVKIKL